MYHVGKVFPNVAYVLRFVTDDDDDDDDDDTAIVIVLASM